LRYNPESSASQISASLEDMPNAVTKEMSVRLLVEISFDLLKRCWIFCAPEMK
jgi:hypothetical protein